MLKLQKEGSYRTPLQDKGSARRSDISSHFVKDCPHIPPQRRCTWRMGYEFSSIALAKLVGKTILVSGKVNAVDITFMLDYGSSVSLVTNDLASWVGTLDPFQEFSPKLVTANGDYLPIQGKVKLKVAIGSLEVNQDFLIAPALICDIILRVDLVSKHNLILDFNQSRQLGTVKMVGASENHSSVCVSTEEDPHDPIVCTTTDDNELEEGCTIPMYAKTTTHKVPPSSENYSDIISHYQKLFSSIPGITQASTHRIPLVHKFL